MPVQSPSSDRSDSPANKPGATSTPPTTPAKPTPTRTEPSGAPMKLTRAGAAWVGIVVGAAVLVLLIVFMLQNTVPVEVAFFGLRGSAPLAVTLLIAGVGFAVVTLIVGSLRMGQLRRRIGASGRQAPQGPDGRR